MKIGESYWNSTQQHAFDICVSTPLRPALILAKRLLVNSIDTGDVDALFNQRRVGKIIDSERIFIIQKLQTLGDDKTPLNGLAARFRKLGVDELAQIGNVHRREMSICGYRPLVPQAGKGVVSYDEVMDSLPPALGQKWQFVTQHSNPGIVSSYGLHHHTHTENDPNEHEIRAEMDIKDAYEASLLSNVRLLGQFASVALTRRLQ